MRFSTSQGFFGIKGGVNATVYDPSTPGPRHPPYPVPTERVTGMHTYANDVASVNAVRVDLFERFVYKDGIARRVRRRSCDDK